MICLRNGFCMRCHTSMKVIGNHDLCSACGQLKKDEEREKVLAPLRELSIEERLERIEWAIHQMSKEVSSNSLHYMTF